MHNFFKNTILASIVALTFIPDSILAYNPEHLKIVQDYEYNPDLSGRADFKSFDLSNAVIYQNLTRVDLTDAILNGALIFDKSGRDGAVLTNSILTRASLVKARLMCADLSNTDLTDANLQEANLRYAQLACVKLNRASCHKTRFENTNLQNATFEANNLNEAYFDIADLRGAVFNDPENIKCDGADFFGALIYNDSPIRNRMTDRQIYRATWVDRELEAEMFAKLKRPRLR